MMELELMLLHERNELPIPETITLYQLLLQRGWVWKMPAEYQAQVVAYLNLGIIDPPIRGKKMEPKIRILTKDGKIVNILTEGVIDVVVEDEKGITAAYTSASIHTGGGGSSAESDGPALASSRSK
jgi:hypothetical protein